MAENTREKQSEAVTANVPTGATNEAGDDAADDLSAPTKKNNDLQRKVPNKIDWKCVELLTLKKEQYLEFIPSEIRKLYPYCKKSQFFAVAFEDDVVSPLVMKATIDANAFKVDQDRNQAKQAYAIGIDCSAAVVKAGNARPNIYDAALADATNNNTSFHFVCGNVFDFKHELQSMITFPFALLVSSECFKGAAEKGQSKWTSRSKWLPDDCAWELRVFVSIYRDGKTFNFVELLPELDQQGNKLGAECVPRGWEGIRELLDWTYSKLKEREVATDDRNNSHLLVPIYFQKVELSSVGATVVNEFLLKQKSIMLDAELHKRGKEESAGGTTPVEDGNSGGKKSGRDRGRPLSKDYSSVISSIAGRNDIKKEKKKSKVSTRRNSSMQAASKPAAETKKEKRKKKKKKQKLANDDNNYDDINNNNRPSVINEGFMRNLKTVQGSNSFQFNSIKLGKSGSFPFVPGTDFGSIMNALQANAMNASRSRKKKNNKSTKRKRARSARHSSEESSSSESDSNSSYSLDSDSSTQSYSHS